jgi:hypothetical protein
MDNAINLTVLEIHLTPPTTKNLRLEHIILKSCLLKVKLPCVISYPINVKHTIMTINHMNSKDGDHTRIVCCKHANEHICKSLAMLSLVLSLKGRVCGADGAVRLSRPPAPHIRCRKPYAASKYLILLMMGVCTRNMSS